MNTVDAVSKRSERLDRLYDIASRSSYTLITMEESSLSLAIRTALTILVKFLRFKWREMTFIASNAGKMALWRLALYNVR